MKWAHWQGRRTPEDASLCDTALRKLKVESAGAFLSLLLSQRDQSHRWDKRNIFAGFLPDSLVQIIKQRVCDPKTPKVDFVEGKQARTKQLKDFLGMIMHQIVFLVEIPYDALLPQKFDELRQTRGEVHLFSLQMSHLTNHTGYHLT